MRLGFALGVSALQILFCITFIAVVIFVLSSFAGHCKSSLSAYVVNRYDDDDDDDDDDDKK